MALTRPLAASGVDSFRSRKTSTALAFIFASGKSRKNLSDFGAIGSSNVAFENLSADVLRSRIEALVVGAFREVLDA